MSCFFTWYCRIVHEPYLNDMEGVGWWWQQERAQMMPDVCCWAIGVFFSLHVSYAKLLTNVLLYINENKKEPKQHQTCVIWAISLFLPPFLCVSYTNKCFIIYTGHNVWNTWQDSGNNEKVPKRRKTCVVWAIGVFFSPFSSLCLLY